MPNTLQRFASSSAIEPTPTITAVRSTSRLCSTRFQRWAACVANRSRRSRTKCSMKMKASSDICGPWKPRAAASMTCFGRFGSAWMWSVPVVSAWISASFGIAVDQLGENLVGADDQDVGARAFRQRLGRIVCGMKAQIGQGCREPLGEECRVAALDQNFGWHPLVIIGCSRLRQRPRSLPETVSGEKHATVADRTRPRRRVCAGRRAGAAGRRHHLRLSQYRAHVFGRLSRPRTAGSSPRTGSG